MSDEKMNDSSFMRLFILMIIAMTALTAFLMILAATTSSDVNERINEEKISQASAEKAKKLKPFGEFSASGQQTAPKPAAQQKEAMSGEQVYNSACSACHGNGVAGAPTTGDNSNWNPRIAQGIEVLYDHAINGFSGKNGFMPAKGGAASLSDNEVKAAVDYMVEKSK